MTTARYEYLEKTAWIGLKEQHRVDIERIDVEFMFDPGEIVVFESV